jgi:hypothetical protein
LNILPLLKRRSKDVIKIFQEWSIQNTHRPKRRHNKEITGIITPESIDTLESKLGRAFTILKSTRFTEGQQYGYLACIILEEKYRIIIADPVWVYAALVNPGAYTATALVAGASAA